MSLVRRGSGDSLQYDDITAQLREIEEAKQSTSSNKQSNGLSNSISTMFNRSASPTFFDRLDTNEICPLLTRSVSAPNPSSSPSSNQSKSRSITFTITASSIIITLAVCMFITILIIMTVVYSNGAFVNQSNHQSVHQSNYVRPSLSYSPSDLSIDESFDFSRASALLSLPSCSIIDHNLTVSLLSYQAFSQHQQVNADCSGYLTTGDCTYLPSKRFIKQPINEAFDEFDSDYQSINQPISFRPRWMVFAVTGGNAGGLGDRLKGLMTAFTLAFMSGRALAIDIDDYVPFDALFGQGELEWVNVEQIPYEVRTGQSINQSNNQTINPPSWREVDWYNVRRPMLNEIDWLNDWKDVDVIRIRHNLNSFTDILDNPMLQQRYREVGLHALTEKGDMDLYWQCFNEFIFTFSEPVRDVLNPILQSIGRRQLDTMEQRRERVKQQVISLSNKETNLQTMLESSSKHPTIESIQQSTDGVGLMDRLYASSWLKPVSADESGVVPLYCSQIRMGSNGHHSTNGSIAFHDTEGFLNTEHVTKIFGHLQGLITDSQRRTGIGKYSLFVTSDSDDPMSMLPPSLRSVPMIVVPGKTAHMDMIDPATASNHTAILAAYVKVVATHYLLGECDVAIISSSGFGATARWRTRNRGLKLGEPLTHKVYSSTYRVNNENATLVPYQHMRASGGREDLVDYLPVKQQVKEVILREFSLDVRTRLIIDQSTYNKFQSSSSLIVPLVMPVDPRLREKSTVSAAAVPAQQDERVNNQTEFLLNMSESSPFLLDCLNSFVNSSHPINDGVSVSIGITSGSTPLATKARAQQRKFMSPWLVKPLDDVRSWCLQAEARTLVQEGYVPSYFMMPHMPTGSYRWNGDDMCEEPTTFHRRISPYDRVEAHYVIDRRTLSSNEKSALDLEQAQYGDLLFVGEQKFESTSSPHCPCSLPANEVDDSEDNLAISAIPLPSGHTERLSLSFIRHTVITDRRAQRALEQCTCLPESDVTMRPSNYPLQFLVVARANTFIHLSNLVEKLRSFRKHKMSEVYYGLQQNWPVNLAPTTQPSQVIFSHLNSGFALSMDLASFFTSNQASVIIQAWASQQNAHAGNSNQRAAAWGAWLTARGRLLLRDQQLIGNMSKPDASLVYQRNHALVHNFVNGIPHIYTHPLVESMFSLPQFSPSTIMIQGLDMEDQHMVSSIVQTFYCNHTTRFDWTNNQWWLNRLGADFSNAAAVRGGIHLDQQGNPIPQAHWFNDWDQEYRRDLKSLSRNITLSSTE